jgi:hypothetical protein
MQLSRIRRKRKKRRSSSSRVCGKVGKMRFLSTFPQTILRAKEKKTSVFNILPTTKSPLKKKGLRSEKEKRAKKKLFKQVKFR